MFYLHESQAAPLRSGGRLHLLARMLPMYAIIFSMATRLQCHILPCRLSYLSIRHANPWMEEQLWRYSWNWSQAWNVFGVSVGGCGSEYREGYERALLVGHAVVISTMRLRLFPRSVWENICVIYTRFHDEEGWGSRHIAKAMQRIWQGKDVGLCLHVF